MIEQLKRCGRCKSYKSVSDFTTHRRTKDGLNYACRSCTRKSRKISRLGRLDQEKEYAQKNKERLSAQKRQRRATPRGDRERVANLKYYHDNKKKCSDWHKQWCRANKAANRRYVHLRRARLQHVQVIDFTSELLAERWRYYGNKCWICRQPATETDHVKPISKGGAHMLCNFRPICKPCNGSKHDRWPYSTATVAA